MPDNNILDTRSFTYKDVPNVNGGLGEEYSGGDDEAPTFVEIFQDNGSWDASSHGTLHKTTRISGTGLVASDESDESTT